MQKRFLRRQVSDISKPEPKIIENSYCTPSLSPSLFSLPLSFPFITVFLLSLSLPSPPSL